jgi:hypothetical protein
MVWVWRRIVILLPTKLRLHKNITNEKGIVLAGKKSLTPEGERLVVFNERQ